MKVPPKLIKSISGNPTFPIVLLCAGLVLGYTISMFRSSGRAQNLETQRADNIAEAYEYISAGIRYKGIELSKPIQLYDGTIFTVYDVQVYEPALKTGSSGRKLAVALDISLAKDKSKVHKYDALTKSITRVTDRKSIDNFYYPNSRFTIQHGDTATNQNSMQWAMQELEFELRIERIRAISDDRLLSDYTRDSYPDERAKPDIFEVWRKVEPNSEPENIRGWVTFIFMIDDWVGDDAIDDSITDGMLLRYKNAGTQISNLLDQQTE